MNPLMSPRMKQHQLPPVASMIKVWLPVLLAATILVLVFVAMLCLMLKSGWQHIYPNHGDYYYIQYTLLASSRAFFV